jgi:RNA polymerase sigma factor (sigma-70 family)
MVTLDPRHVEMAKTIALSILRRLPRNVQRQDVEQAGLIGLLDALRRHPDGEGPGYEVYLRCRIRGEIYDELRRQSWGGRRRVGAPVTHVSYLDDHDDQWQDAFAGQSEDPEQAAITRIDAAKAWRTPQKPRDIRIMRACYEGGRRHLDVGRDEGISEARVSQLVTASLVRMQRHLTGAPAPDTMPRSRRTAGLK